MKVGDLVEGFSTSVVGLKGILTKIERKGGTATTFGRTVFYILWSDGRHLKHMRHQFTTELT